jgi:hypothetical protein
VIKMAKKGKGDLRPSKGKVVKKMGGTELATVDMDTRTILSAGIGPRKLSGGGSGKITTDCQDAINMANKKKP